MKRRVRPPGFEKIARFREEFGLDADLAGDQEAIRRRIRNLQAAWLKGNPVARSSAARYGVPLRAVDARYLEMRETLVVQAARLIPAWAAQHAPTTYAGYDIGYVDGLAVVYVGFTERQDETIAALRQVPDWVAPDRIVGFPTPPQYTEAELWALLDDISDEATPGKPLWGAVSTLSVAILDNKVEVGARDVVLVQAVIHERFGADAPIVVVYRDFGARRGPLFR